MELAINLDFVQLRQGTDAKRSVEESLDLCREAGFMRLDYLVNIQTPDYLEQAKRAREAIDARGMKVIQSHCPFFRYGENGLAKFREFAPRAVEAAAVLGADFLVIHADEYRSGGEFNAAESLRQTRDFLAPVIDLCVQKGVRPAIENLFEDKYGGPGRSRYTSEAEEVLAVLESFPDSGIGCCWDSGHHNVSFGEERFFEKLEMLAPYIVCTHMHDNRYGIDMHKPAFFGAIDWAKVMEILKKAGYQGDFTWEFVYERIPDGLYKEYMHFMYCIGDYLRKL